MGKIKRTTRVTTEFSDVRIYSESKPENDSDTKGNVISFATGDNGYAHFSIRREDIPFFVAIINSFL